MANFKMSGNDLHNATIGSRVAYVQGNDIYNATIGSRVAYIQGNDIYNATIGNRVAYIRGNDIYNAPIGNRIAAIDEVKKAIQGATGKMTDVALWLFFVVDGPKKVDNDISVKVVLN